ncbi:MAG: hypothetical protein V1820_00665 [archaeon]
MVKKAIIKAGKRAKSLFTRNWKVIGGIFLIFLMAASVFGGVVLSGKTDAANDSNDGEHVGTVGGIDVYKVSDNDYYANLGGVEVHFRANPAEAGKIKIDSRHKLILSTVMAGPNHFDILSGKKFEKTYILLEPDTNATSRVTVAAAEISTALGANGWVPEVAFTKEPSQKVDAKIMNVSYIQKLDEAAVVFYFSTSEGIPGNTSISSFYTEESKGVALFIVGKDLDSLDLAAVAVKMFLLGWTD